VANDTYTSAATEPLIDRLRRAVIGRYDVYAELGSGGMASVFLALDLALDRKVAIKVMSPALANSPDNIERFKREAKVSASLNHPHIIGILAVGDDPELAFFVMKYIEGRSLDSVIKDEGKQSVPFVQSIISSAGKALYHSHTRGIIHRDVKPANFMLDKDGWLIVTDFGIAKQGESKGLTMTGSIIGTPYYMSPEQFHGKPVTPSADQYALGVVAYELLTGKQPYTGDTIAEVMRGVLFDEVPRVRALCPEVPQVIDDCVAKMMAKNPDDRYANLEDAVMAFGSVTPTLEAEVRTQIINLAKLGALQQPRMDVPLSPVPMQRPAQKTAVAGKTKSKTVRQPAPELEDDEEFEEEEAPAPRRRSRTVPPEPKRSKTPMLLVLLLVLGGGAAGVWFTPSLRAKLDTLLGTAAVVPPVVPAPVATIDSTPIRDSILRAQIAREFADSVARADSITRAAAAAAAAARRQTAANTPRQTATRPPATAPATTPTSTPVQPPPTNTRPQTPTSSTPPTGAAKDGAVRTTPATQPVATQPAPTQTAPVVTAPPPAPTGPGTIRIGSRVAGTVLYLNDDVRPIGERGMQSISWAAGSVRVQIRAEKCAAWDTTFTVAAGQTHTIGWRAPRC
jgi:serine/threonine protein kinase